MSSIGVVVFRNSPLGRTQVLQECVNNSLNISNNENEVSSRQEIVIVRKRQKIQTPAIVPVTSLVRAAESGISASASAKRPRIRDEGSDDSSRTPTPLAVAKRNARERNRVRQVNDGFAALRRHIPEEVAAAFENANSNRGSAKKLSKVETLRMAVEYIRNLETLLNINPAGDKENNTHPSMESFPSPASSSPRDNSQEKSYFSLNSPTCDEDDFEEDDLDASMTQLSHHQYINVTSADHFHLVSTPHLYEEDEGQPLTPCSDLLGHDEVNSHILEGNFQFPNVSEQFTVIPDQSFCGENTDVTSTEEFEIKYADSLHAQVHVNFAEHDLQLESINPDLMINQQQYKMKTESDDFVKNQHFNEVELKKELPDIRVTPEDREQFEETLKWWQEKTRLGRSVISYDKTT